jgi:hypothetical protein
LNILTMHGPINVKSLNNTSKWQMGFNSAFKRLRKPRPAKVCLFTREGKCNVPSGKPADVFSSIMGCCVSVAVTVGLLCSR